MNHPYKRLLPVALLIAGVVVLGLAISLNIYSYFYPKQGVITITLNEENDYSFVQPLFFNYHGHVKLTVDKIGYHDKVYVVVDNHSYVLDYGSNEIAFVLGRGGHRLYFESTGHAAIRIEVEDYLVVPGENTLLLLAGLGLTVIGVVSTIYYCRGILCL